MHSRGVAEGELLGDVARGERHTVAEHIAVGAAAQEWGDVETTVGAQRLNSVGLWVDRAAPVACVACEVPTVPAGLNQVSDRGAGSFRDPHADLVDVPEADELGAQLRGQAADEQRRVLSGQGIGQPCGRGRLLGVRGRASVE